MAALEQFTVAEHRSRAMGSALQVVVIGAATATAAALRRASERVEELEQCWSRFRPDSELSRLNRSTGPPVDVTDDMATLLVELDRAWRWSGGAFDPSLGSALTACGYDRSFVDLQTDGYGDGAVAEHICRQLDPGGLGKGLAADLVVEELRARRGVEGVLVSIGGDLRCDGMSPNGDSWTIEVGEPMAGVPDELLMLDRGAIATSTPGRRRWRTHTGWAHHLLDPRSHRPAEQPPAAVTVVADRAVDAEWIATAVASGARELLCRLDGDFVAIVTEPDGSRIEHGPIREFQR